MKKTTNSNTLTDNQTSTLSPLSFIKLSVKKVSRVFTGFLLRQRKPTPKQDEPFPEKNNDDQVKEISYSSTRSDSKSSSRLKYSSSYGSSKATSGEQGMSGLSLEEIYKATGNFAAANKIGEGGFGTVYRGKLKDGSLVAIKRAKKDTHDLRLSAEFKNEIMTLSVLQHLNLVRLFGYLEHGDEQIIVVEYVGNGNLREHLDGTRGDGLEIAERLDVAIDVAHAITYLHMYMDRPIIHRDIKASNILITEKLHAKVTDFGFARLFAEDPNATHISTQIKGTTGYLDPEYLRTYQLTEKSDVYSFGVLLVEMMTGRQPIELKRNPNEKVTIRWAMQRLKEGEAIIAMDPRLRRSPASNLAVEKILKLARKCLASSRQSRPSMKQCGEILWKIRKEFRDKIVSHTDSTSNHSANNIETDARRERRSVFGIEENHSYGFRSV